MRARYARVAAGSPLAIDEAVTGMIGYVITGQARCATDAVTGEFGRAHV